MKILIFILSLFSSILVHSEAQLKYPSVVDISKYKGQTYLSLMREVIKPEFDRISKEGFYITSGQEAVAALSKVDTKVSNKALKAAGSPQKLKAVVDALSSQNEKVTFYELPQLLSNQGIGSGRYDLTTYIGLISGGGVAVHINADNVAYNVNYGSGQIDKDEMTGRSFGEAPGRRALDASDKHYLQILEKYVRTDGQNIEIFYRSILSILTNNDVSEYSKISAAGQAVATDFLAVYTAEQDRHLMSNLKKHAWDEALLEVTLLSAFHAGQNQLMLMYNGELTDTTYKQTTGCNTDSKISKKASLIDYWQFSKSTDPTSCSRSGINVTRRDFRNLGAAITSFQRRKNPALVAKVERHFKSSKYKSNLFAQLSNFLISTNAARSLTSENLSLAEDFTAFLMQAKSDANLTTQYITETWIETSEFDNQ